MKTKFKLIALALLGIFTLGALFSPTPVFASNPCDASLPPAIKEANGCPGSAQEGSIKDTIIGILNAVITISGLIATVFVVIGGIQYMTSTGDAGKVKKAKDTILYAAIGIAVCVLSYAIVNWVILNAIQGKKTPSIPSDCAEACRDDVESRSCKECVRLHSS